MTATEKNRLSEILLYYFFEDKDKVLGEQSFWKMIENLCLTYGVDSLCVSKAIRILMSDNNAPQDAETYYLLDKIGAPVRAINKMTGIYWQKQVNLREKFEKEGAPEIKPRITDIVMRRAVKDFIYAIVQLYGVFGYLDIRCLKDI